MLKSYKDGPRTTEWMLALPLAVGIDRAKKRL